MKSNLDSFSHSRNRYRALAMVGLLISILTLTGCTDRPWTFTGALNEFELYNEENNLSEDDYVEVEIQQEGFWINNGYGNQYVAGRIATYLIPDGAPVNSVVTSAVDLFSQLNEQCDEFCEATVSGYQDRIDHFEYWGG